MINLLSPRNKEEADCFYKILIHSIQEIEGNDNCEYSITWKTVHKQRGLTKTYKTAKKGKFLKFSYQKEGQTSVEIHEPFELFSHFSVSSMYSPEQKVTFSLCEVNLHLFLNLASKFQGQGNNICKFIFSRFYNTLLF